VDSWKRSFVTRLHEARSRCARQFEDTLERFVVPAFEDLAEFLRDNGFKTSSPLREPERRSFKFELAENAYLLMIFRFAGVGEFELRTETFVPGVEPVLEKSGGRVLDIDASWAQRQFQAGLDRFVDLLAEGTSAEPAEQLVTA